MAISGVAYSTNKLGGGTSISLSGIVGSDVIHFVRFDGFSGAPPASITENNASVIGPATAIEWWNGVFAVRFRNGAGLFEATWSSGFTRAVVFTVRVTGLTAIVQYGDSASSAGLSSFGPAFQSNNSGAIAIGSGVVDDDPDGGYAPPTSGAHTPVASYSTGGFPAYADWFAGDSSSPYIGAAEFPSPNNETTPAYITNAVTWVTSISIFPEGTGAASDSFGWVIGMDAG